MIYLCIASWFKQTKTALGHSTPKLDYFIGFHCCWILSGLTLWKIWLFGIYSYQVSRPQVGDERDRSSSTCTMQTRLVLYFKSRVYAANSMNLRHPPSAHNCSQAVAQGEGGGQGGQRRVRWEKTSAPEKWQEMSEGVEKCRLTSPGLGGILCNWEVCKRPLSHSCVRHTCPDACRVSEVTEGCFLANVHEVKFPRMKVHKSLRKSPPLLSRRLTISNFPMAVTSFKLLLLCSGRGFRQKRYCQESPTSK